jgi:hypothetical protein
MGCGCGGSTTVMAPGPDGALAPRRVEGGPGEVGYTWNGPVVPAPAPAPEAAPAAADE